MGKKSLGGWSGFAGVQSRVCAALWLLHTRMISASASAPTRKYHLSDVNPLPPPSLRSYAFRHLTPEISTCLTKDIGLQSLELQPSFAFAFAASTCATRVHTLARTAFPTSFVPFFLLLSFSASHPSSFWQYTVLLLVVPHHISDHTTQPSPFHTVLRREHSAIVVLLLRVDNRS